MSEETFLRLRRAIDDVSLPEACGWDSEPLVQAMRTKLDEVYAATGKPMKDAEGNMYHYYFKH